MDSQLMRPPARLATLLPLLAALLLAGCGFVPRGSYPLPPALQRMAVTSSDEFAELPRIVARRLELNDVEIVPLSAAPPATLRLLSEKESRRTLSLYADGRVAEYALSYQVDFQLLLPEQPPQQFSVTLHRDFLDDPSQALAKSREQELLRTELRQVAADQIVRQLATLHSPAP